MSTARRGAAKSPRSVTRHFAPRDFDISPYFTVVKPKLVRGFNYKDMQWADIAQVHAAEVTLAPEIEGVIEEMA